MEHPKFSPQMQQVLDLAREPGLIRTSALATHGLPRVVLSRLVEQQALVRVARGVYALPDSPVTEHLSLAEAILRVPSAVVCLLSALRFYGLTTQAPHEIWLALPRGKSKAPKVPELALRFVTMSPRLIEHGIRLELIQGVPVRITTPARTVADCFKFRNTLGLDVALEALRAYRQQRIDTLDALYVAAHSCRMTHVMQPYLEVIG